MARDPAGDQAAAALTTWHGQSIGVTATVGGRVRRDTDNVDPAGGKFQEEGHVNPFEEHRVDGEEVAGHDLYGPGR